MSQQDYTLSLVIKALDEFSSTFSKLNAGLAQVQGAQGKVAAGTKNTTTGLGQLKGAFDNILRGNFAGAFQGIAGALGPVGVAAAAAAGTIGLLWKVFDNATEAVKRNIEAVDEISDRYRMTAEVAGQLVNMATIMGVSTDALARSFKTMSRQGLQPSIEGLIGVKERLDAIDDPAKRTAEAYRLLGRGAMTMADLLNTSTEELRSWAAVAKDLAVVTSGMTDAQDSYNRVMGMYKIAGNAANIVLLQHGLLTKQSLALTVADTIAEAKLELALILQGVSMRELTGDVKQLIQVQGDLNVLDAAGIDHKRKSVEEIHRLAEAARAANPELVKLGLTEAELAEDAAKLATEQEAAAKALLAAAHAAGTLHQSLAVLYKQATDLNLGDAAGMLQGQAARAYGGAEVAAITRRAQGMAERGQLGTQQVQNLSAMTGATQLLAGTADFSDVRQQLKELGMTGADAANTVIQATTQAAAVAVTTGAASMDQATSALATALGVTSEKAAGMLQVVIDKMAAIEDKDVTVTVTTEYVDKMSKQYTQYSQFGSGHLRPGTYNVGEAGTEGLTIDEAGRVGIVPHWKWMASGAGVGRRGFKLGTQVESGGDLSSVSFNFGGAAAAMAEHRAILASGTSGLRGSETVAAVTSAGAAVQASQAVAQEVQTAVVAAIQSSQAQLATTVSLPVVAASVRAEQASKENAMLLMQILAVLRRQGTVADNARAVSEAVVLAGQ